jgi:hypothetical protein
MEAIQMPKDEELRMTDEDEIKEPLEAMVDSYLVEHPEVLPDYAEFEEDPVAQNDYLDLTITVLEIVIGPRPGLIFRVTFDDDGQLVLTRREQITE